MTAGTRFFFAYDFKIAVDISGMWADLLDSVLDSCIGEVIIWVQISWNEYVTDIRGPYFAVTELITCIFDDFKLKRKKCGSNKNISAL